MKLDYAFGFALAFSLVFSVASADFIDADAKLYVLNGSNVTIKGYIRFDNSSGINRSNVTGSLLNSNFSVRTNTSLSWLPGYFEFNVTAPNSTGRYNVTVNTSTLIKNIEIKIGNISSVAFNFTGRKPPFANGSYFELNVSFTGTANETPRLEIFNPNGANSSGWIISNISSRTNAPTILYNITVPANADGRYVLIFDEGAGSTVFLVKSSIIVVAATEDLSNSSTANFGQGESISIRGKVRDDNGPVINANVNAIITLPNGTTVTTAMAHNLTGTDGTYSATFNTSSAGGLPGTYKIEIIANSSGKIVRSTSSASVQQLQGELGIVKDFFFNFGSASTFQKNGPVEFNVLVYNLTNDILLNGSMGGSPSDVNCSDVRIVELKNVQNSSLLTPAALTNSTNLFSGQSVCKMRFTAPNADGVYSVKVNATVGLANLANKLTVLATGYFSIQSYILKPSPVSSLGGGKEFLSFLMPGDNATFEIAARNLSASGASVDGGNITGFNVTKISPMSFTGGASSDITNITVLQYTSGSGSSNPRIQLKLPENRTGPFQIEFRALVGGSVITGTSFYFARYVEGFAFPGNFGGGFGTGGGEKEGGEGFSGGDAGGPGGPGGPAGGSSFSGGSFRCSGAQNFSAKVFDVRTRQAAKNVVFNSVQEAREELTGRSVASSLSIASSSSTDSSGFGNITINFTGSFSGFYFMLINITTADGKSDSLPAGFECRQLSFFPSLQAIGSTGSSGFFVAPSSAINVTISGIRNLNAGRSVNNGTVSINRIESFDPGKGQKMLPGPAAAFTLLNGTASFTLSPANFTGMGGKWFSGFNDMRIQVCDNTTTPQTCDSTHGGFMVVAFDAFPDFSAPMPTTLTLGQNVTYNIMAKTNVTNFTVQVGLPWEGSVIDATVVNYSLKSDGWNNSGHNAGFDNFERWNVTFAVPSSLRKGGNMIKITATNYLNETTDIMTFASAGSVSVSVPDTEGVAMTNFGVLANVSNSSLVSDFYTSFNVSLTAINASFKSTNSKSGTACLIMDFNTTRFGMFSQPVSYKRNITLVLIDNTTPGVYDTLIINNSNQVAVANANNRSLASAGFAGLYLVSVRDCGSAIIVNTTLNGTGFGAGFGGQHAVNSVASIPIIVKQGALPRANAFMDVSQLVQQEDFGGGRGGFGFVDFLSSANYTRTGGTTDGNGVAFLLLNVAKSGLYSIIWNISSQGTTDTAEFSEGIPVEIKSFVTNGGVLNGNHPSTFRVVSLERNSTQFTTALATGKPGRYLYSAAWNESLSGPFINDATAHYLHVILRNETVDAGGIFRDISDGSFTEIAVDNDTNFNFADSDGFAPKWGNWTAALGPDQPYPRNLQGDSLAVDGNLTVNSTLIKLLFVNPNMFFNYFIFNTGNSNRVDRNITVRACGLTFAKPATPLIGANITGLTTKNFTFNGPPVNENLVAYDPFSNSVTLSVLTGPSGCATFNVSRSGGWRTGSPNEIKATITSGGASEGISIGSVFVSCAMTGPCF